MRHLFIGALASLLALPLLVTAQPTRWDRTIGDKGYATRGATLPTPDGGFITATSTSASRTGDVTQPNHGSDDIWLVKFSATGQKQWDRSFGGVESEWDSRLVVCRDGGYLLGGQATFSYPTGDHSQPGRGQYDYWVIKTDSLGQKQWERRLGTTVNDALLGVTQTTDGGFVLVGHQPGDTAALNGDRTHPNHGLPGISDIWVVKLDATGQKLWDRVLGGSESEEIQGVVATPDGGCVLGAGTASEDGDVTQASRGSDDFWIVKLDVQGQISWQRRYGGADEDSPLGISGTRDGGFLVAGQTYSGVSGDKTEPSRGGQDCWVLKLDSTGQKEWERTLGTNALDITEQTAVQTATGDYIVGITTDGGVNGDKTQPGRGSWDYWIVCLRPDGTKRWDRRFGTSKYEFLDTVCPTPDRGVVLVGSSEGGVNGDKTTALRSQQDLWIVKVDSAGNQQWDRSLGGDMEEHAHALVQLTNGDVLQLGLVGGHATWGGGIFDGVRFTSWDSTGTLQLDVSLSPGINLRPPAIQQLANQQLLLATSCWGVQGGVPIERTRYVIMGLSAQGQQLWNAQFDGPGDDWLADARQTTNLGFVLGGTSRSGVGGDRTAPSRGTADFWVVKTNAAHTRQWDQAYGGAGVDSMTTVRQTLDGGYLLAGTTWSGPSGEVTEPSRGGADYWLVKTDAQGVLQWQHRYGGPADDVLAAARLTPDGGFLLAGTTASDIGGEVSEASLGGTDAWLVKLDAQGVVQWQHRFGGSSDETVATAEIDPDNGYIIGATTTSDLGGDMHTPTQGGSDYWLLRVGPSGQPLWEKRLGGSGEDILTCLATTRGYGYAVGGYSDSPTGSGDHTAVSHGAFDYWTLLLGSRRVVLGLESEATSATGLTLYPNPTSGQVRVQWAESLRQPAPVQVLDGLGRCVQQASVAAGATSALLPLAGLPAGVYTVRVGTSAQRLVVE